MLRKSEHLQAAMLEGSPRYGEAVEAAWLTAQLVPAAMRVEKDVAPGHAPALAASPSPIRLPSRGCSLDAEKRPSSL